MDAVHYYWHPEQRPTPPPDEAREGFFHGFELAIAGLEFRKAQGHDADPVELAKSIKPTWKGDVDHLADILERGRPKPDTNILQPDQ